MTGKILTTTPMTIIKKHIVHVKYYNTGKNISKLFTLKSYVRQGNVKRYILQPNVGTRKNKSHIIHDLNMLKDILPWLNANILL